MHIALMGTRGVPARYGGFETAAEEIGSGLAARGHAVTVYCRDPADRTSHYRGMARVTLPAVRTRTLETLSHGGLSALDVLRRRPDAVIVFNAAHAPWLGLLAAARLPVALHVDGHDGLRSKWSATGRRYYSLATRWGARLATEVVVDSAAIQAEMAELGTRTTVIPYGAAARGLDAAEVAALVGRCGLEPRQYHLVVARFEPENQVLELVRAYSRSAAQRPLVLVGFAGYPGPYTAAVEAAAAADPRVRLLGPVWDQRLLDALYSGATTYLHGHSVGGTNPSLLRAMAHRCAVIGYDCAYNRETTGGHAWWFDNPAAVAALLEQAEADPEPLRLMADAAAQRVQACYRWPEVVREYDRLVHRLVASRKTDRTSTHAA